MTMNSGVQHLLQRFSFVLLLISLATIIPTCLSFIPTSHSKNFNIITIYESSNNNENVNEENASASSEQQKEETPLEKALRKAKAKAEINRLTMGPDAIFDMEEELRQVYGYSSTPLSDDEVKTEAALSQLEHKLSSAIEACDYKSAAKYRDELQQIHIDDCGRVLQANSAFYRALSDKNLEEMKRAWMESSECEVILPQNGEFIRGYNDIVAYFTKLFELDDVSVRLNMIQPSNIRLNVKGLTAWVSCDEEIYAPSFKKGLGPRRKLVGKIMASNIFRKIQDKWCLMHHHATWVENKEDDNSNNMGLRLMGNMNEKSSSNSQSGSTVKRVFMGSLSDLLSNGLSSSTSSDGLKTIIQLSSNPFDDDLDHETNAHDGIEDDDIEESLLSKWSNKINLIDSSSSSTSSSASSANRDDKQLLRQGCISTLRKLCAQGSISQNQKRVLLSDIISCSAKGQNSMVEVAFDLLLLAPSAESLEKIVTVSDSDAEEEFADQCRALADCLLRESI